MTEGTFGNPKVVEEELDILLIGGGMACCGAAYEIMRWAEAAKAETGVELKIKLVDKAAMDRSGAVAQGLSAINTYIGPDMDPADYARMVSNDLMGITRDDLAYDLGRHVDESVHLFEEWGLPIWKTDADGVRHDGAESLREGLPALKDGGKPVRSGKWQIMINGESYKWIVAEAAKKALGLARIEERIFIVKLVNDKNDPSRIAGAVGFSVRDNTIHVYKAKAILLAAGGCVNLFRPRSVGEGTGRAWYPVWNAGSTYAMAAEAGAEMTMMENRFVPARFKDGYGPVGAWFLLFKAKATNAYGEDYMVKNKALLDDYPPYGQAAVPASCLRNHLMLKEMKEGRGPIYMDTVAALARLRESLTPKEVKHLESEAWEDFLDMCIGQCGIWAGENIEPDKKNSELMPTEPYLLGSHSGCCGIWVSGSGGPRRADGRRGRIRRRAGAPAARLELGLSLDDDGQGAVHRRRRRRRVGPQVLVRARTPRAALPRRRWSSSRSTTRTGSPSSTPRLPRSPRRSTSRCARSSSTRTTPRRSTSIRTTSRPRCCSSGCRRSWTSTWPAARPTTTPTTRCSPSPRKSWRC